MEISIYFIIYLLFCHWVADFVLQSSWMATNKSKSNKALAAHCLTYGLALWVLTPTFTYGLLNGLIHFPVDYVTSRINTKLWNEKKVHWFFTMIGLDQLVHFATLLLTYKWLILS